MIPYGSVLVLLGLLFLIAVPASAHAPVQSVEDTLILADPTDPYYTLAGEIVRSEGLAVLHGLYALARLDQISTTSKGVELSLLAPAATFLLAVCGTVFFLNAKSWRGRAVALAIATLGALAPAVLLLLFLGILDDLLMGQRLGAGLWNCRLGWQPLIVFLLVTAVLVPLFHLVRKDYAIRNPTKENSAHA